MCAKAFSNPDTYISHVDSKLKGLRPLYSHQHTGNKVAEADATTVKPHISRPRRSRTPLICGLRLLYNSLPHLVVYYNPAKLRFRGVFPTPKIRKIWGFTVCSITSIYKYDLTMPQNL